MIFPTQGGGQSFLQGIMQGAQLGNQYLQNQRLANAQQIQQQQFGESQELQEEQMKQQLQMQQNQLAQQAAEFNQQQAFRNKLLPSQLQAAADAHIAAKMGYDPQTYANYLSSLMNLGNSMQGGTTPTPSVSNSVPAGVSDSTNMTSITPNLLQSGVNGSIASDTPVSSSPVSAPSPQAIQSGLNTGGIPLGQFMVDRKLGINPYDMPQYKIAEQEAIDQNKYNLMNQQKSMTNQNAQQMKEAEDAYQSNQTLAQVMPALNVLQNIRNTDPNMFGTYNFYNRIPGLTSDSNIGKFNTEVQPQMLQLIHEISERGGAQAAARAAQMKPSPSDSASTIDGKIEGLRNLAANLYRSNNQTYSRYYGSDMKIPGLDQYFNQPQASSSPVANTNPQTVLGALANPEKSVPLTAMVQVNMPDGSSKYMLHSDALKMGAKWQIPPQK